MLLMIARTELTVTMKKMNSVFELIFNSEKLVTRIISPRKD